MYVYVKITLQITPYMEPTKIRLTHADKRISINKWKITLDGRMGSPEVVSFSAGSILAGSILALIPEIQRKVFLQTKIIQLYSIML